MSLALQVNSKPPGKPTMSSYWILDIIKKLLNFFKNMIRILRLYL